MVSQGKDIIYGQVEMRKYRGVTDIKTLQIMLYDEMAHIVHDERATYGHSGNICLRSATSSILTCYVLIEPSKRASALYDGYHGRRRPVFVH